MVQWCVVVYVTIIYTPASPVCTYFLLHIHYILSKYTAITVKSHN